MARWSVDENRVPTLLVGGKYRIVEYQMYSWGSLDDIRVP